MAAILLIIAILLVLNLLVLGIVWMNSVEAQAQQERDLAMHDQYCLHPYLATTADILVDRLCAYIERAR